MGGRADKANEKKAREAEKAASAAAAKQKAAEDAAWADDGIRGKGAAKKEEEARKAAEAAARKAENKRLAEAEMEEAAKAAKGKATQKWNYNAGASKKVTAHELYLQKEAELKALEKKLEEAKMAEKGLVSEEEYARLVEQVNANRRQLEEDARGLDEALKQLGLGGESDEVPTLTFSQFLERELPRLKEEKPGLKLPQYRDQAFKLYERAIENPRSQARKDWEAGRNKASSMAAQALQKETEAA